MNVDELQEVVKRCPFNVWLGLLIKDVSRGQVVIEFNSRDEYIGSPEKNVLHGGVIASAIDAACCYAVVNEYGRSGVSTVDLRVDYCRPARPGRIKVVGKIVKTGKTLSIADAEVYSEDGAIIAIGRALCTPPVK